MTKPKQAAPGLDCLGEAGVAMRTSTSEVVAERDFSPRTAMGWMPDERRDQYDRNPGSNVQAGNAVASIGTWLVQAAPSMPALDDDSSTRTRIWRSAAPPTPSARRHPYGCVSWPGPH